MSDLVDLVAQCYRDSKRWFPGSKDDLGFMTLAMLGEGGELANLVKKVERGTHSMEDLRAEMGEEAVDVLIYLCNIFAILGVDPVKIYAIKRAKNERRFGNGNGQRAASGAPATTIQ